MTVNIARLLCSRRHCLLAAASNGPGEMLKARVQTMYEEARRAGVLLAHCPRCNSATVDVELTATEFRTMDEARESLAAMAAAEICEAARDAFLRGSRN